LAQAASAHALRARAWARSNPKYATLVALGVAVVVAVIGLVSSSSSSACMITGIGSKLCGGDAVAYCDIHYADYAANGDVTSAASCDAIAPPGRYCAESRQLVSSNTFYTNILRATNDAQGVAGYKLEQGC
jgi:hypothetical protein